ncbi:glycosyltransferase [Methylophaga sp.]|uniref:glycosyltransferase n=1 Tax=Methylophaga sp. TaxID=2024840 RepID=UPI003A919A31
MQVDKVWFTWEDHRRSRELADSFNAKYVLLESDRSRFIRYLILSYRTIKKIVFLRPSVVFCQNPSIVLASLLCVIQKYFGFILVVDRHSNFKFEFENSKNPIWKLFLFLSKYSVRKAHLTIVTNIDLQSVVDSWGGRAEVLPDKLPNLYKHKYDGFKSKNFKNVFAITTFDSDEPIEEMLGAASLLSDEYRIYFTGNYEKFFKGKNRTIKIPKNVEFLGFVPEDTYRNLLGSADVAVVLTKKNLILNCGAYESVSLNIPSVVSNTRTMKEYFYKGFVYTDIDPESIAQGIISCAINGKSLKRDLRDLKVELESRWNEKFLKVLEKLE